MWSDRIRFVIPWERFTVGKSIFIPCLDPEYTLQVFKKEAGRRHGRFIHRVVVEKGVMGLRIWRTL